jgi:uncharacterized protein (TIGR03067 family)
MTVSKWKTAVVVLVLALLGTAAGARVCRSDAAQPPAPPANEPTPQADKPDSQKTPIFAVGFLGAGTVADKPDPDLEKFQGTWVLVGVEADGKIMPVSPFDLENVFTFTGNKTHIRGDGMELPDGTFKIDSSKSPKEIDLSLEPKKGEAITTRGIYEFKGDTLRICGGQANKDRPKDFSQAAQGKDNTMVFKRPKGAEPKQLHGTWNIVANDSFKGGKVVIRDDKIVVEATAAEPQEATFRINHLNPQTMTVSVAAGKRKGDGFVALYTLNDDELQLCLPKAGNWPVEADAKPGLLFLTLRRQKD